MDNVVVERLRTIWKFTNKVEAKFSFTMARGAHLRHAAADPAHEQLLSFWFELDPKEKDETTRTFHVVGTGHRIPPEAKHFLGTVIMGAFVWHLYEEAF